MTRIDAHLHVWRSAGGETPGVHTLVPPQTDVPIELADATLRKHRVERAVLVQPVFRGEDNSYIAACARAEPTRYAAVCVVDPRKPGAAERLEHWVDQGCRGVRLRPRLPAEESIFAHPASYPLWRAAERRGTVVSILCDLEHASVVGLLAERFSQVTIVIDHLAHPYPLSGANDPRFRALLALARFPRVMIKLSGYYHFSDESFPFATCWDLIRAAYDRFGPERLLWGSDFPHVRLKCGYDRSLELPAMAIDRWAPGELDAVMGGNACQLYWPDSSATPTGGDKV